LNKHPAAKAEYFKNNEVHSYDQSIADRLFARLVGSSTIALNQASSSQLSAFTSYLNPSYKLPSRNTIVSLIGEECDHAKALIKRLLTAAPMVGFSLKL